MDWSLEIKFINKLNHCLSCNFGEDPGFKAYMNFAVDKPPTKKQFLINLEEKENDPSFIGDMEGLLRNGIEYKQADAFKWIRNELISELD